jgi:hypothetical protein
MKESLRKFFDFIFSNQKNPTSLSRGDFLKLASLSTGAIMTVAFDVKKENYPFGEGISQCDGEYPYAFPEACIDTPRKDPGFLHLVMGTNNVEEFIKNNGGFNIDAFCHSYLGTLDTDELRESCKNEILANIDNTNWAGRLRFRTVESDGELFAVIQGVARPLYGFKKIAEAYGIMTEPERIKAFEGVDFEPGGGFWLSVAICLGAAAYITADKYFSNNVSKRG